MKSSTRHEDRSLFWAAQKILFAIGQKCGFDKERLEKLEEITGIVFSGREKNWKKEFKFDISFNAAGKNFQGVRFSCNNKEEGVSWIEKIGEFFSIFPGAYGLQKICAFIEREEFASLTIGLDWERRAKEPKFKLYFEGGKIEIERFLENALNPGAKNLGKFFPKGLLPCAVAFNFFPNNQISPKIYFYINEDRLCRIFGKKSFELIRQGNPGGDKDHFFLLAIDFSEKNEIISKKIYSIYETREFYDKSGYSRLLRRYGDVKRVLTKTEGRYLDAKIGLFNKETSDEFLIYPIGFSIGLTPEYGFGQKNIYISLIKKNAEK